MSEQYKKCSKCGVVKAVFVFSKSKQTKDGLYGWCRDCVNIASKKYYEHNKPDHVSRNLRNRYNITLEEYDEILKAQNGVCAICGKPEITLYNGATRRLNVDHNHITGQNRGLLCLNCNTAIGSFQTDATGPELLLKAVEYIRRHQ